jgi:outer membrane protein assembly factor BamB
MFLAAFTGWGALASADPATTAWPQFRGPDATGVVAGGNLPEQWTAEQNVRWKTDLPGMGWSSPIVWGDKIFLTTAINLGDSEEPKKGLYFGGNRPEPPQTEHEWRVYCLDLNSGQIIWNELAHRGVPSGSRHIKNSFASETPITDGQRVYAYFGNLGLFCYDLNGKPLWSKLLGTRPTRFGWGTAASPVLHEGRLYLVDDNDEESYLLALDAANGNEIWRVTRDEKSNWATPLVWKNEQRTEIVTPGTGRVRSYDLDGKLLWELEGMSSITIATPYSQFGNLYLSSGYVMDKLRPVYAIKPGAIGDITLPEDQTSSEYIAWVNREAGPYNPSTLVYGDYLYVLLDRGFFACYDAHTGQMVYDKQRIPEGKAFTSSPWAYQDKIFCINEDGVTFVIGAGPEFKLLHTNPLAEDDMAMATPAIAGDKLLIRTAPRLYCIENGAKLAER